MSRFTIIFLFIFLNTQLFSQKDSLVIDYDLISDSIDNGHFMNITKTKFTSYSYQFKNAKTGIVEWNDTVNFGSINYLNNYIKISAPQKIMRNLNEYKICVECIQKENKDAIVEQSYVFYNIAPPFEFKLESDLTNAHIYSVPSWNWEHQNEFKQFNLTKCDTINDTMLKLLRPKYDSNVNVPGSLFLIEQPYHIVLVVGNKYLVSQIKPNRSFNKGCKINCN